MKGKQFTHTDMMHLPDPILLSPDERRIFRVLRVATKPRPCAGCGTPVSRVDASGLSLDSYPADNEPRTFTCPHCKTRMWPRPPVIAAEGPFCWAKLADDGQSVPRGTLLT